MILWTALLIVSLFWNIHLVKQETRELAKKEALATYKKDQAFRFWATKHGGVYVPPTEDTPPNPYLSHIPDRDIRLPSGKRLTLMNPAYILRQVMKEYEDLYGVKGHITSLELVNPMNAPDAWERMALGAFEKGEKEVFDFAQLDGRPYLRLMRPMVTQKGCLKCHGYQEYKEGDIRGGVSVSVPMAPYLALENATISTMFLFHGALWLLGLTGIGFVFVKGMKNILDRERAEEKIRKSEERFRNLVETTTDWVWEVDKNGVYTYASQAVRHLLGYEPEEVIGKTPFDLMAVGENQRVAAIFGSLAADYKPMNYLQNVCLHKDGRRVIMETCGVPFFDSEGLLLGYRGVDRDITERAKMQASLAESEARHRTILETVQAGIVIIDTDTHAIVEINPAALKMIGETRERIIGKVCHGYICPAESGKCPITDLKMPVDKSERVLLRADGTSMPIIKTVVPISLEGRTCLIESFVDLTEIKESEERLAQQSKTLDSFFRCAISPLAILDRQFNFIRVNEAYARAGQRDVSEFPGHNHFEWYPSDAKKIFEEVVETKRPYQTTARPLVYPDHPEWSVTYWDWTLTPILSDSGEVEFLVYWLKDVTEAKQTEEKLRESERFKTIANQIFNVFLTVPDEDVYRAVLDVVLEAMESKLGIFGFINENGDLVIPSMTRQVWDACQTHGKSIVFPPHAWGESLWGRAIREKKVFYSNAPFHVPEGHLPIFNFLTAPIVFGDRTIGLLSVANKDGGYTEEDKVLFEAMARAISPVLGARMQRDRLELARRKSEEDLKALTGKISLILNSAGEGIYGVDLEGRVTLINPTAARMLGYEVEELLERPSHATWHHHNPDGIALIPEACKIVNVLKDGVPCMNESGAFWRKDGTQLPIEYSATPTFEADKLAGAVVIFRDVTEKRRLEAQLRQAQKMEAVGTLASGIAHDFNNILAVIMAYGHMTRTKLRPDDPLKRNLDNMLEAADRAANLTRSLLGFSRRQIMERRHEDLNQILNRVVKFLMRVIGEDVALQMLPAAEEVPVYVDAPQIEQVLLNLATNARDAMPDGGTLTISAEVVSLDEEAAAELGIDKTGDYALVTVADTGVGMPEEVRRRIFEPFFTTKEVGKGTGLGLAVAYGIVQQHEGSITVQSEPGQGTTFRIFLALAPAPVAQERQIPQAEERWEGTETILLAEDNELLRVATAEALQAAGYTVIGASDGEEAVRLFRECGGRVDLCLFDLMMPRMSGREAFEEIRKAAPTARVLFTSGFGGDTLQRMGLSEEGMPIIHKPASTAVMLKGIREALSAAGTSGRSAARPGRRVLMIDDDQQYRELVEHWCSNRGHIFAGVDTAAAALAALAAQPCDVLLVDLNIPGTSGERVLRGIRAAGHAEPAIVLTGTVASADMDVLRPLGVVLALDKSSNAEPLLRAIEEELPA